MTDEAERLQFYLAERDMVDAQRRADEAATVTAAAEQQQREVAAKADAEARERGRRAAWFASLLGQQPPDVPIDLQSIDAAIPKEEWPAGVDPQMVAAFDPPPVDKTAFNETPVGKAMAKLGVRL